jgi:hypothetical protein
MGGSPMTTQNTQQQSATNPWAPAAPVLSGILGQLGGPVTNAGVSPDESTAFDQLAANAQPATSVSILSFAHPCAILSEGESC